MAVHRSSLGRPRFERSPMNVASILPPGFPPPLAAYSHAVVTHLGDATMLFVAGQVAVDASGQLVSPDIEKQTEFIFDCIATILSASGMIFADLVKVQIFLTDMDDLPRFSPVRNRYLGEFRPASTLIAVSKLARDGCR